MYDALAARYHLIFADWDASIARQGSALSALIRSHWPRTEVVLDVACGIGTQSIALASNGFRVKGSDVSVVAVERARREAAQRGLGIEFAACDMRDAFACHGGDHDLVLCADNSILHLLDDGEIQRALESMHACLKPGGGCLLTVRDYDREPRGTNLVKPSAARIQDGKRFVVLQVWDFAGELYDLTMYVIEEDLASGVARVEAMRSKYYALGTDRLLDLMRRARFASVQRLDDVFYQPVLIGTRSD